MLHGSRLIAACAVAVILPPAMLLAYHFAPKDVTPEEAEGILYMYTADT